MRALFVLFAAMLISQVSDVFITKASAREIRTTTRRQEPVETIVRRTVTREVKSPPKRTGNIPVVEDISEDGDDEDDDGPQQFRPALKRLASTARNEADRRAAGAVNTTTGLLKLSSGSLGLFGRLVRDQLRNLHSLANAKYDLLHGFARNLTNGAINVMQGVKEVGGEGARVARGTFRRLTDTGKTATRFGGALLDAPIKMTDHAMQLGKRLASIPPMLTKTASDWGRIGLSVAGVHSDEDEDVHVQPVGFEEYAEHGSPAAPAPKPRRTASSRR